ncbi:hypothetical protein Tco_0565405 [Tanacetum coccineum]
MAISVISVSSDSSEESVGTSTGRVILFGTIPTTIPDTTPSVIPPTTHIDTTLIPTVSPTTPPSPDYTPVSPDYSPISDKEFDLSEDPSSDHIPLLQATSPFLSLTDDSSDNDIPDTPPLPTYGTPFTETTLSTQSLPIASETSSDSSADALSDSASSRSSSDHSLPTLSSGMRHSHHLYSLVPNIHRSSAAISDRPSHDSSSASPSRKRSRSPTASVPLSSPTLGALSYARPKLLPSPKRIRSLETATDLEGCSEDSFEPYVPREAGLGVDFEDESSEPSRCKGTNLEMDVDVVRSDGIDIDLEIQAEIDECIAYADALRYRRIDARVVVEAIDREEIETSMRGPVEVRVDRVTHPVGHRIVATGQQSVDLLERIRELERDNMRLIDMMDVASQRVSRSQRRELRVQREMRQIRRFRFYDRMRIARLEACARRTMPNTRSGTSRTREGIIEKIDRQMAGALGARTTARNLEPLIRDGGGQEEVNGNEGNGNRGNGNGGNGNRGNGNGGNGNGNGNGGGNGYNFRGFVPARECTYQDFQK